MNQIIIRKLEHDDYHLGYLQLLKQLTKINPENISFNDFKDFVDKLTNNHQIIVLYDQNTNKVIGTITVLIEAKLIHDLSKVCHIEDVVIDINYRKKGLGKLLIEKANEISKQEKCYKTILDCSTENSEFYKKCNFTVKGVEMALYHD